MTVSQFATADELATILRSSFDATEQDAADLLLQGITGSMQRMAGGQKIELVTDDVATLQGTWERELILPQWPVVSVSSVKINDTPIAAGTWFLTGTGKLYRGYLPIFNGPTDWGGDLYLSSWVGPVAAVEVTYTHGINPLPADIKMICLTAAARAFSNPEARTSESVANVYSQTTDVSIVSNLLTSGELEILSQYGRQA